eukprot:734828-Rhodomonas_salina.2
MSTGSTILGCHPQRCYSPAKAQLDESGLLRLMEETSCSMLLTLALGPNAGCTHAARPGPDENIRHVNTGHCKATASVDLAAHLGGATTRAVGGVEQY